MKKFGDPTGNGEIWITQTTHGESASNPNDLSKQQAIDIRMYGNEYYHNICEGIVELVTTAGGGYISVIPTGCNFRVLYVHVDRPLVKKGQKVYTGTKLGQIKVMSGSHLHLGFKNISGKAPHPNPMEYISRGIPIKPAGSAIKKAWFDGDRFKWEMFKDKYYLNNEPTPPPTIDYKSKYEASQKELSDVRAKLAASETSLKLCGERNSKLESDIKIIRNENADLEVDLDVAKKDAERYQKEYMTCVEELNKDVNSKELIAKLIRKFGEWLSKLFKKQDGK